MIPVVFDLDGTLIDSAPDIHRVANEVLALEGLSDISFAEAKSFVGNGVEIFIARALAAKGLPTDGSRHARMTATFEERYEHAHELTVLYDGVAEALGSLASAGHTLGLCTNKPCGPTRTALAHFDLADCFTVVVGGDTLPQRKPDPAPLLHTLKTLGTETAIFVGDSEVDAETAHRAGVPFVLFTEGYRRTPVDQILHASRFDSFDQLKAVIETIAARV